MDYLIVCKLKVKDLSKKVNIKRFWKNTKGSFTLEASIVFPIILFTTLLILFMCMYQYQNTMLKQAASKTSERAAYTWDNSHKDINTGAFPQGQDDGLYWRIADDNMISGLFGWAGAANTANVAIPGGSGGSLPASKLAAAASWIPGKMSGNTTYNNHLMMRNVNTTLSEPISLGALERELGHPLRSEVSASSVVVEPVEFIRTIELMRYYGAKFTGKYGAAMNMGRAGTVLQWFSTAAGS